mmetsp:Transcript_26385/g.63644  ORF Transcript_26385/g.63644 Transcript_26385/m.63644 type:complete len:1056 (-) Transcript_26385:54-3221(-)
MGGTRLKIAGFDVEFPFRPYPSQLAFMSKVLQSISLQQNALLESPTGTGKSLALLCSALAWQEAEKREIAQQWEDSEKTVSDSSKGGKKRRQKPPAVPMIYYATRTHSQIAQIVQELGSTVYRPTMSILASRRRYCVNAKAQKSGDVRNECERLLEFGGCSYFHNAGKLMKALPDVWDVEDLVGIGKKRRGCPYFGSRLIAEENCELIFCPYSYIIDPLVRSAMGIDCKNSIVIFDEAHNIEDISRDSASGEFSFEVLNNATMTLQSAVDSGFEPELLRPTLQTTNRIVQWMKENEILLKNTGYEREQTIFTGTDAVTELEGIELTSKLAEEMVSRAAKIADESAKSENKSSGVEAGVTSLLVALYTILGYLLEQPRDYTVVLLKHSRQASMGGKRRRRRNPQRIWEYKLMIWCMNPAVAFRQVSQAARATILTSGTLAPFDSFESELDTPFLQRLEARHVIKESNLVTGIISRGPNAEVLKGTYQHASTYTYQDAVGALVSKICTSVPDGVLVFFPSYKLLENCCERWKDTGTWRELETKKKCVCVETRDAENFEKVFQKFRSGICSISKSGDQKGESGSVLLAVCRGKVSEGIDFTDRDARAVIVVGIPYPNYRDEKVKMKRAYNDHRRTSASSSSMSKVLKGSRWYELQAFRALNQAIGRCIRHRDDYGAILLIDTRFGREDQRKNLSRWFRNKLAATKNKTFDPKDLSSRLEKFFERHEIASKHVPTNKTSDTTTKSKKKNQKRVSSDSCRALFLLRENARKLHKDSDSKTKIATPASNFASQKKEVLEKSSLIELDSFKCGVSSDCKQKMRGPGSQTTNEQEASSKVSTPGAQANRFPNSFRRKTNEDKKTPQCTKRSEDSDKEGSESSRSQTCDGHGAARPSNDSLLEHLKHGCSPLCSAKMGLKGSPSLCCKRELSTNQKLKREISRKRQAETRCLGIESGTASKMISSTSTKCVENTKFVEKEKFNRTIFRDAKFNSDSDDSEIGCIPSNTSNDVMIKNHEDPESDVSLSERSPNVNADASEDDFDMSSSFKAPRRKRKKPSRSTTS